MNSQDNSQALLEQIKALLDNKQHAYIQGQHSRPNASVQTSDTIISVKEHSGVINYEPSELVIKVRAGTLIKDIQQLLKDNKQQLGTDFPDYGNSTVGGAIATGETGSGRPFLGAIRDQVLGLGIINGQAQAINFGGQVMKNVAGYDVSRLMCGSLGQLSLITDVTLKVIPLKQNVTIEIAQTKEPLNTINQLAAQPFPITAAVIDEGQIRLRLSGSPAVTDHAINQLKADKTDLDDQYWESIHNKQHPFFQTIDPIWQIRLDANQPLNSYYDDSFIDWCGHQRYIKSDKINKLKMASNISATPFKNMPLPDAYSHLDERTLKIHRALKSAFDPNNLFNRQP